MLSGGALSVEKWALVDFFRAKEDFPSGGGKVYFARRELFLRPKETH